MSHYLCLEPIISCVISVLRLLHDAKGRKNEMLEEVSCFTSQQSQTINK